LERATATAPLTHCYGADPDQVADLYLPDGRGPFLLAVVIHGGFWRARFGRELMHGVCCDLQERGIAAWNVEYRRLGTGGGWPASLEDVQQAIAALPTLDESRIDPGRVVLVGHSAGGHLALLAGAHDAYVGVTIAGVLALAAVSDLALADELGLGAGAVRELLADNLAVLPEASPRALLPLRVCHLHVHGDADDRVPVTMTTAFVEAAGREAAVTVLPGVDHFALIDPSSTAWAVAVRQLTELLKAGCGRGA
jgi:acetyl esterase/lipase